MKVTQELYVVSLVLCLAAGAALAERPPPPPLTLGDKVVISPVVVLAEVEDVEFIRFGSGNEPSRVLESVSDRLDAYSGVLLQLRVLEPFKWSGLLEMQWLQVLPPDRFAVPADMRTRYLGKRLIFFLTPGRLSYIGKNGQPQSNAVFTYPIRFEAATPEAPERVTDTRRLIHDGQASKRH